MKARFLAAALLTAGFFVAGLPGRPATAMTGLRQSAIVNFTSPVTVAGQLMMGPYLIIHDDEKMAHGEPCTTFYRFDPSTGPKEAVLTFQCRPARREVCDRTTFTLETDPVTGVPRLAEYQFRGDSEGHGVPSK